MKKENYKRRRDLSKKSVLFAPKFEWHYTKDARVAVFVENIICLSSSATSLILQRSKQKERGQEYIGASSMHHIRSCQSWSAFPIQCGAFCWIACTTSSKCVMLIATCPLCESFCYCNGYMRRKTLLRPGCLVGGVLKVPLKEGSRSLDEAEAEELRRARLDSGWGSSEEDEQGEEDGLHWWSDLRPLWTSKPKY
jgi:hypothetical protein